MTPLRPSCIWIFHESLYVVLHCTHLFHWLEWPDVDYYTDQGDLVRVLDFARWNSKLVSSLLMSWKTSIDTVCQSWSWHRETHPHLCNSFFHVNKVKPHGLVQEGGLCLFSCCGSIVQGIDLLHWWRKAPGCLTSIWVWQVNHQFLGLSMIPSSRGHLILQSSLMGLKFLRFLRLDRPRPFSLLQPLSKLLLCL